MSEEHNSWVTLCVGTETDQVKALTQKYLAQAEISADAIADTELRHYVSECIVNARIAIRTHSLKNGTLKYGENR